MKRTGKKALSLLLAFAILCSLLVVPVSAAGAEPVVISTSTAITEGGTYQLSAGLSAATITVSTTEAVTIVGSGVQWDSNPASATFGEISSAANTDLLIDCSGASGVTLTLKDVYISNASVKHNMINFSGTKNTLIFDGTVVLDHDNGALGYAGVHVGPDTELTIYGTAGSHAYLYKSEQAAGIGADSGEVCGSITFGKEGGANDFYFYMKGSKQGAVIGNGASCPGTPGDITFLSGIYNLIAVARGALIGGSAGATSLAAGNVYIRGGLLNLNVDYSGAAIGGGGYDGGNDKGGGYLYISGGSIRTYIDTNAVSSWASYGVTDAGVNDVAITATKVNAAGDAVYLLAVDTSGISAGTYTIKVDGAAYYSGPRYEYCYYYETVDRGEDGNVPTNPLGTPGNWLPLKGETNLYLYLTGEDHTVEINGVKYRALWDSASGSFTLARAYDVTVADSDSGTVKVSAASAAEGETVTITATPAMEYVLDSITVTQTDGREVAVDENTNTFTMPAADVTVAVTFKENSWYDNGAADLYVIDTAKKLSEFAAIVNGTATDIAADSFAGKTVVLGADIDLSDTAWVPIGSASHPFFGIFDGDGHTISGLNVNTAAGYAGLFGKVDGTIRDLAVNGSVTTTGMYAGGVVGWLFGGAISGVASNVNVNGSMFVGGIAGQSGGTITNCYTTGNVSGTMQVGGITGNNSSGSVENCYSIGTITGNAMTGGIAGTGGTVVNSYCLGSDPSDETAKTADEMKTAAFVKLLGSGYNGDNSGAAAGNNGYPVLTWQGGREVYTVTFLEEEPFTASPAGSNVVFSGEEFRFTVTGTSADPESALPVVKAGGTVLNPDSGLYTVTVHSDVTITVRARKSFTVTFDVSGVEEGKTSVALTDAENAPIADSMTVLEGNDLVFKLTVDEGYLVRSVTSSNGTVTKSDDGPYRLSGVSEDTTVTIVVWNAACTVTLPEDGEGYSIAPVSGYTTDVNRGSEFKFTVTPVEGYTIRSVTAGGTTLLPGADGVYTVTVTDDMEIAVTAELLKTYTVTFILNGVGRGDTPVVIDAEGLYKETGFYKVDVREDRSLNFKLAIDDEYTNQYLIQSVTRCDHDTQLDPVAGVYTLTEISDHLIVSITVGTYCTVTLTEDLTGERYTIAASDDMDGVASDLEEGFRVANGTEFTFRVTAKEGYKIDSVKANEIELTAVNKNGDYVISVSENVTVTVEASKKLGGDPEASVWDGVTIDVRWFTDNPNARSFYITYPAELAGLAALVNGIYNEDIQYIWGDDKGTYIVDMLAVGTSGSNNESTEDYHYGAYDFSGRTIYLCADIDMGTDNNYMPIGGQYLMTDEDTSTKIGSSFCGVLDGQGHNVTIYCDRHCSGNYGDGQSVGLIGRLGVHDNDPESLRPTGAGVYNLAVYGYVKANRSVGAIVGKIGRTNGGAIIANCANFATVYGTDAKGTGGICGAAWNGGEIRNCYNAGTVTSTYTNAVAGIAGSCEIDVINCYNVGSVVDSRTQTAAIASQNGGSTYTNCYWLTGSADIGVYGSTTTEVVEKTEEQMKSEEVLIALGSAFAKDTGNINNGYPVFEWQVTATAGTVIQSTTTVKNGVATTTVRADDVSTSVAAAQKAKENTLFIITDTKGVSVDQTVVQIPQASIKAIADASLSLSIETADGGRVTMPSGILSTVAGKAAGTTIALTVTPQTTEYAKNLLSNADGYEDTYLGNSATVSVSLSSGGVEISGFTSNVTIEIPVSSESFQSKAAYDVLQVLSDGAVNKLSGQCITYDGQLYVSFSASKLGTFIVLNQAGTVIESTTTVKNGVATTTVTAKAVSASVAAAQKAKADTLFIITDTKGVSVDQTVVEIPQAAVEEIADASLSLSIKTADGSRVTMPSEALSTVAGKAAGETVALTVTPQVAEYAKNLLGKADEYENTYLGNSATVSVGLSSGGVEISGFISNVTIEIPVDSAGFQMGKTYDVLQVLSDGTISKLSGTCVSDGGQLYVAFITTSFGTLIVLQGAPIIYDDVLPEQWFYEAVMYVTNLGLMNGIGDNKFDPSGTMTRAMLVTVLHRLENSPAEAAGNVFDDVPGGTWYTDAVNWATAKRIVEGYGNGSFGPEDNVTREQIVTILYRYLQYPGLDVSTRDAVNQFMDSSEISSWAYEAMQWAVGAGIITGKDGNMLDPLGNATRAEAATMLQRLINLMVQ